MTRGNDAGNDRDGGPCHECGDHQPYPVPDINDLPQVIKKRTLAVQEKAGYVPNVVLVLAHRPDEFNAQGCGLG
jgi:hypothetical protein